MKVPGQKSNKLSYRTGILKTDATPCGSTNRYSLSTGWTENKKELRKHFVCPS